MARLITLSTSQLTVLLVVVFIVLPLAVDLVMLDNGFIARIANLDQDEVVSPRLEREFGITLGPTDEPSVTPVLAVSSGSFLYEAGLRPGHVIFLRAACIRPLSPLYGRRHVLQWLDKHRGEELTLRFGAQRTDPNDYGNWTEVRVLVPKTSHTTSPNSALHRPALRAAAER